MLAYLLLAGCATSPSTEAPEIEALAMLDDAADLRVQQVLEDELAMSHTRARQYYQGIPVWGGETIIHQQANGDLASITDTRVKGLQANIVPDYTAKEATDLAVDSLGGWARVTDQPEAALWIFRQEGVDHLVWRVQVPMIDDAPTMPVLFVDAHDGSIVSRYENLQTACPSAVGAGSAYYSGVVSLDSCKYSVNKYYYLESTSDSYATLSFANTTTRISYLGDSDNSWTAASQKVAVQAHYNTGKVVDYYASTFGRNGVNDAGGPGFTPSLGGFNLLLTAAVSYGKKYNNAFWDSSLGIMVYGDGDGKNFGPLVSTDISGHEMTHGVIQYTAGLNYTGESGGLNEAYADIFGAMIERYVDGNVTSASTWIIGEDAYTPSTAGDGLRYMSNPAKDKNSLDYYKANAGKYDVHYSSGIANLAFYLLSEGGAHPTRGGAKMVGIGADAASEIWYRALVYYLTSSSTFADARNATLSAAADLYGSASAEYAAVANSWTMVGV